MPGIHENTPLFTEISLNLLPVGIGKHTPVKNKFTHFRNTALLIIIIRTKTNLTRGRMIIIGTSIFGNVHLSVHPCPNIGLIIASRRGIGIQK